MAAAAPPPDAAPTFNWTGMGQPQGAHIHYQSFNFAGQHYALGDCVYLLPEEEGSPPYIARLMRAYEDTTAREAERLVIEVQWFERRSSLPQPVAASMHELEVVESDLIDTNLVGCLDSKATIITANSYEEACQMIAPGHEGEWHFCRGVWDSEAQHFKSYAEMGAMGCYPAGFGQDAATAMYQQYQQAALNGYGDPSDQDYLMDDDTADLTPRAGGSKARGSGNRSRRAAAARVAAVTAAAGAAAAAAGNGYARAGVPGKVCCECGATATPQWREGPKGPKTLCNACGVRYQRQQSKAKSNKRPSADRGGRERSPAPHGGGRGSKHARVSASNTPDAAAAAAAAAAVEDAFAAALEGQQVQISMAEQAAMQAAAGAAAAGIDPAEAAAAPVAAAAAPQHHHGTRRNAKQAAAAAAAAAAGGSPKATAGARGGSKQHKGGSGDGTGTKGKGASSKAAAAAAAAAAAGEGGGGAGGRHKVGHPALAAAVAAAGQQLGYFADEGSPPNSNTRILDYETLAYEEEEGAQQQQQQLKQTLARCNTQEAAAALQDMVNSQQQQQQQQGNGNAQPQQRQHQQNQQQQGSSQQQQQQQPGSGSTQQQQAQQQQQGQQQQVPVAATTSGITMFSALGSPATALLIAEQGMPSDSMPMLSLDDKSYRPGTPSGLGVTDSLDGMHPHSLSPLKPHTQQLLSGGGGAGGGAAGGSGGGLAVGREGSTSSLPRYGMPGSGAVCASPGRLISAMVQNLKLPAPLTLNPGLSPLGPAATTLGLPSGTLSQHQQQPGMLSDLLVGAGGAAGEHHPGSSGSGRQQQQLGDGLATEGRSGRHNQQQQVGGGLEGDTAGGSSSEGSGLLPQLCSLVQRASSYTPDVHGLGGLYPGPATPRASKQLRDQLEALPAADKAQLQQVSAAIEDSLGKAKAAEAAVLAVTQVLATKQATAAEARAELESKLLQLRTVLHQLGPAVAAAAAGEASAYGAGSSLAAAGAAGAAAGHAAATPTAADAAAAAAARPNGSMPVMTTAGTCGFLGQGYGLSSGAGGMLGLAEGVPHPYGPAAAMAHGPLNLADTDDLLRDPDDVAAAVLQPQQQPQQPPQQQQQQPVKVEAPAGAAGLKLEASAAAATAAADEATGASDQKQQQQEAAPASGLVTRQEGGADAGSKAPASAAAAAADAAAGGAAAPGLQGPQAGAAMAPTSAAESAPVAA